MAYGAHTLVKANAAWIVLVNLILQSTKAGNSEHAPTFTYGQIARIMEGKGKGEMSGGSAMNFALGAIQSAILKYNKGRTVGKIPLLNDLVVSASTGKPGRGSKNKTPPDKIWAVLSKKNSDWLIGLTEKLNFERSVVHDFKVGATGETKKINLRITGSSTAATSDSPFGNSEGDLGPSRKFYKEAHWSLPRHHPYAKCLAGYLQKCKAKKLATKGVRADFFYELDGKRCLFEVKPDTTIQSTATGIGQLLLYGRKLNAEKLFLVLPGATVDLKFPNADAYSSVLSELDIWTMPIGKVAGKLTVLETWQIKNSDRKLR